MLCTDAQRHSLKQVGRIVSVIQNRTKQFTGQIRGGSFLTAVRVDSFTQQPPNWKSAEPVIDRAYDFQPLLMLLNVLEKCTKAVPQEKAHRNSRCIGGETKNIEFHIGVQQLIIQFHSIAGTQFFQCLLQLGQSVRRLLPAQNEHQPIKS